MNNPLRPLRTGSPKRRRFSHSQIQQLLDDFHRSGLSAAAFARQHGLGYSSLCRWRKRHGPGALHAPRFHPLPLGALLASAWAAEIALPNGLALRLNAQASPAWVAALLPTLRRPC